MSNGDYYLPAIALAIAFAAKLPALRRGWRDPLIRSVLFLLFTAALCFLFAAPPTISAINGLVGIRNFSAPLVYCILCSFSCACLVLIVNWRGGHRDRVRRSSRRWISAYGAAIVAIPVLFALGETPVERLRDLDTYYANTPFIREMIVTYLAAHIVAAVVTTAMCLRWARAVAHWLRIGLVVLVIGLVFNLLFGLAKLTALVARWTGRDWDALSTAVAPPMAAMGGMIITVGFLLPLVGPRVSAVRRALLTYLRLGALWRRLRPVPGGNPPVPRIPWWAPLELRLTVRETVIHDELLRLQPYLDDRTRQRVYSAAVADRAPREQARLVAVAGMVIGAARTRAAGRPEPDETEHQAAGADALTAALTPGRECLVLLSRALRSPLLETALSAARGAPAGPGASGASGTSEERPAAGTRMAEGADADPGAPVAQSAPVAQANSVLSAGSAPPPGPPASPDGAPPPGTPASRPSPGP
ncbi:MAB_1171c family putative transporter [Streptomyces sp. CAU 1734]|uniref:MAB_1171c family putative transporter n=1 Tax=Streptomyces sp. CAU 1734 TaxID=3140360 RepID=UPI003260165E